MRSLALIVFWVGCSGEITRPTIDQLKEGLNLLDARDPAWGLNAAFVKAGRVVYLETRLGPLKPEMYREAYPDDPPNETDLRFVDQSNNVFFVQRGGDAFADTTWAGDVDRSVHGFASVKGPDRTSDFELAKEASAVVDASMPSNFQHHTFYFRNFAQQTPPAEDAALNSRLTEVATKFPPPVDAQGYANWSTGSWVQLYTALYSGSTAIIANHSATIQYYNPNVGAWWMLYSSCNHGRCYYDSGMSYQCWSGGGAFGAASLSDETNSNSTAVSGGCASPYNWNTYSDHWYGSTGVSNTHLCNDDASYELWQSKSGSSSTAMGDQNSYHYSDRSGNHYACSCNSSHNCNGDWSVPACP